MIKRMVLSTLFLVFLLSAMGVTSVAVQPRIVGVTAGSWFKYGNVGVSWTSNDPNATFPPLGYEFLEEQNETEWVLMSVLVVSDTNVTFQGTIHYKNGTEEPYNGYVDVDTGTGENMTLMAISANLNANDTCYTSGPYSSFTINETIMRTYPDSIRETNHLNMIYEYSFTINETQCYYCYAMNLYWDRATGIYVEDYWEGINQTGEYLTTWSASSEITESSVWVVPEFPTWISTLLVLVVLSAPILIYKRRRAKTLTL